MLLIKTPHVFFNLKCNESYNVMNEILFYYHHSLMSSLLLHLFELLN